MFCLHLLFPVKVNEYSGIMNYYRQYLLCAYPSAPTQGSKLTKISSHNFATGYQNLVAI